MTDLLAPWLCPDDQSQMTLDGDYVQCRQCQRRLQFPASMRDDAYKWARAREAAGDGDG